MDDKEDTQELAGAVREMLEGIVEECPEAVFVAGREGAQGEGQLMGYFRDSGITGLLGTAIYDGGWTLITPHATGVTLLLEEPPPYYPYVVVRVPLEDGIEYTYLFPTYEGATLLEKVVVTSGQGLPQLLRLESTIPDMV